MEEIEVPIRTAVAEEQFVNLVERVAAGYGLYIRMRGTLRVYPGSIHLHLEKQREPGTLEITLWPAREKLWLSVQAGRRAGWIVNVLPQIKAKLEAEINA